MSNTEPDHLEERGELARDGLDVEPSWPEQLADELAERHAEAPWRWAT